MPDRLSVAEQLARDRLNKGPDLVPGQLPPRPASLLPDPLVLGTDRARIAHDIFNRIAPELRRSGIKSISPLPNRELIEAVSALGDKTLDPAVVMRSSLVGHSGNKSGDMFISPVTDDPKSFGITDPVANFVPTLLHELSHRAGYSHESGVPKEMEQLALRMAIKK